MENWLVRLVEATGFADTRAGHLARAWAKEVAMHWAKFLPSANMLPLEKAVASNAVQELDEAISALAVVRDSIAERIVA